MENRFFCLILSEKSIHSRMGKKKGLFHRKKQEKIYPQMGFHLSPFFGEFVNNFLSCLSVIKWVIHTLR